MRTALHRLSWAVVISFLFIAGVGASGSIWGGVITIALLASMFGIICLGD